MSDARTKRHSNARTKRHSLQHSNSLSVGAADLQTTESDAVPPWHEYSQPPAIASSAAVLGPLKRAIQPQFRDAESSIELAMNERDRMHVIKAQQSASPASADILDAFKTQCNSRKGRRPSLNSSLRTSDVCADRLKGIHMLEESPSRFILLPNDSRRRALSWLVVLTVLVEVTVLPFAVAVGYDGRFGLPMGLLLGIDAVHILGIIATLNTAYIEGGTRNIVQHRGKIACHYLGSNLLLDVIALLPWWASGEPAAQLVRLLRIRHLIASAASITGGGLHHFYAHRALSRFLTFLVLLHLCACGNYALSSTRPPATVFWRAENAMDGGTVWEDDVRFYTAGDENDRDGRAGDGAGGGDDEGLGGLNLYVNALYLTMCIFEGEAVLAANATSAQRFVAMAMMVLGMLFTAQLVADVAEASTASNLSRLEFQKRLNLISEKMSFYHLRPEVQHRVRLRYIYAWKKYRDMQANDPLAKLCPSLGKDLATTLYLDFVRSMDLFRTCTVDMCHALAENLAPQFFLTGDLLFREGASGDAMYLIEEGIVRLQLRKRAAVLVHLSAGDYFGEMVLLSSPVFGERRLNTATRMCSAIAVTLVDVLTLSEVNLLHVSREYPEVLERILTAAQERGNQSKAMGWTDNGKGNDDDSFRTSRGGDDSFQTPRGNDGDYEWETPRGETQPEDDGDELRANGHTAAASEAPVAATPNNGRGQRNCRG